MEDSSICNYSTVGDAQCWNSEMGAKEMGGQKIEESLGTHCEREWD